MDKYKYINNYYITNNKNQINKIKKNEIRNAYGVNEYKPHKLSKNYETRLYYQYRNKSKIIRSNSLLFTPYTLPLINNEKNENVVIIPSLNDKSINSSSLNNLLNPSICILIYLLAKPNLHKQEKKNVELSDYQKQYFDYLSQPKRIVKPEEYYHQPVYNDFYSNNYSNNRPRSAVNYSNNYSNNRPNTAHSLPKPENYSKKTNKEYMKTLLYELSEAEKKEKEQKIIELREYLKQYNLEEYLKQLGDIGYDSIECLKTIEKEDLDHINMKIGHQRLLLKILGKNKNINKISNNQVKNKEQNDVKDLSDNIDDVKNNNKNNKQFKSNENKKTVKKKNKQIKEENIQNESSPEPLVTNESMNFQVTNWFNNLPKIIENFDNDTIYNSIFI